MGSSLQRLHRPQKLCLDTFETAEVPCAFAKAPTGRLLPRTRLRVDTDWLRSPLLTPTGQSGDLETLREGRGRVRALGLQAPPVKNNPASDGSQPAGVPTKCAPDA